jgi:hypothetical protein
MSTSQRSFTSTDILRAAASIIERHGQDAVVVTAEQADKLLGEGGRHSFVDDHRCDRGAAAQAEHRGTPELTRGEVSA